jgi:hypothetical protein
MPETGEVYYEYMCDACLSLLLTINTPEIVSQFVKCTVAADSEWAGRPR